MSEFEATIEQIESANIPKRYIYMTISNFEIETNGQRGLRWLADEHIREFSRVKLNGESLVICGKPGSGKTHITCAILQAVLAKGYKAFFVDGTDLVRFVQEKIEGVDFLVIDDIEPSWQDTRHALSVLHSARIPFVLTTTLSERGLKSYLGEKCYDRFFEGNSYVVSIDCESYRNPECQN